MKILHSLLTAGTLLTLAVAAHAQSVGIGTTTPDAAALDISATGKGLLIPRMDSATRAHISSPPDGLKVFQTNGRKSFWYAMSSIWLYIPNKIRAGDNLGRHTAIQALALSDNGGVSIAPQMLLAAISPINASSGISVAYTGLVELATESPNWQTVTSATSHTVRNDLYIYNLRVRLNQNISGSLLLGARIGYTVAQPD